MMIEMKGIIVLLAVILLLVGHGRPEKTGLLRIHTLFWAECRYQFDWKTVCLMHSYRMSRQPGPITRLLSCAEAEKNTYKGMDLAPTFEIPLTSRHPKTGDWCPAINKPEGIVHWLEHSKDAQDVDWVVILDADMIIRRPILPWELGAERGKPLTSYHGDLDGCDNDLAILRTKHSEPHDKVGGLLVMHIDDLRVVAPKWLSKTEEILLNEDHQDTRYSNDIRGAGWICEMYGYCMGAAEAGLRHKINHNLMIYPGHVPQDGVEPVVVHYELPFTIGNLWFSKLDHHEDDIVYDCHMLFPEPPYRIEDKESEVDSQKRRALFLDLESMNTLNEGLLLLHAAYGCPKPKWLKYLSFLASARFEDLTGPKLLFPKSRRIMEVSVNTQDANENGKSYPKIHTIFSAECSPYFDWQSLGLVHSFHQSGQPGDITRLLSCTEEDLKHYKGHDLAPTHYVPSMSRHPLTGDWYPAINKPYAVVHWINHVRTDAEYVIILDSDMIMRGPITPWEFKASRGRPVSTPNDYLIGCENELARIHTRHPDACSKVGAGVTIMHIADLRRFSLLWLHKTEEVRADVGHWSRYFTGDVYEAGWMSEMYGYSFAAAELNLRHVVSNEIMIYPGHVPVSGVKYRVLHYSSNFRVGNWSFDKANWRHTDMISKCWAKFPDPPDRSALDRSDEDSFQRDLLCIECVNSLNEALLVHSKGKKCPDPSSSSTPTPETPDSTALPTPIIKTPDPTSLSNLSHETPDTTSLSNLSLDTANQSAFSFAHDEPTSELKSSRKLGRLDEFDSLEHSSELSNDTQESALPSMTSQTFFSVKFWIIGLWACSIFGFVTVMSMVLSRRRGHKRRGKTLKSKRRTSLTQDHGI